MTVGVSISIWELALFSAHIFCVAAHRLEHSWGYRVYVCESRMCQMTAKWWAQLPRNVWSRSHAYKNTFKSQTGGVVWEWAQRVHTWSRGSSWLFQKWRNTLQEYSACQSHLRAAFIQRPPTHLTTPPCPQALQTTRLLLWGFHDPIQIMANNSNEESW